MGEKRMKTAFVTYETPSNTQSHFASSLRRKRESIGNMLNETVSENLPNLGKDMGSQEQEASRLPSSNDQKRSSPQHVESSQQKRGF
jgi:hypothetical protein